MSRTYRAPYSSHVCLRSMRHHRDLQQQSMLRELTKDFGITVGNRPLSRAIQNPWDDVPVAGRKEARYSPQ